MNAKMSTPRTCRESRTTNHGYQRIRNHADNRETHRSDRTYDDPVHEIIHDVRAALERSVPQLDPTVLKLLANEDVERVNSIKESGLELSIFLVGDVARCCKSRVGRGRPFNMTSQPDYGVAHDEASTCGGALSTDPRGALRGRQRTWRLRIRPTIFHIRPARR